jgi:hypothetical protein
VKIAKPETSVAYNDVPAQASVEKARLDAQAPDGGAPAGVTAETTGNRSASKEPYGIFAGLLVALLAFALFAVRRRSRARSATVAAKTTPAGSVAATAPAASANAVAAQVPRPESKSIESGIAQLVGGTVADSASLRASVADTVATTQVQGQCQVGVASPSQGAGDEQAGVVSIVPGLPERSGPGEAERPAGTDPVARLIELARLRADGLLTEAEFNQLKASLIASTTREGAPAADPPPQSVL